MVPDFARPTSRILEHEQEVSTSVFRLKLRWPSHSAIGKFCHLYADLAVLAQISRLYPPEDIGAHGKAAFQFLVCGML